MSAAREIRQLTALVTQLAEREARQTALVVQLVQQVTALTTLKTSSRRGLSDKPSAVRMRRLRAKRRAASRMTSKVTLPTSAPEAETREGSTPLPEAAQVTSEVTAVSPSSLFPSASFPDPISTILYPSSHSEKQKQMPKQSAPPSTVGYFELRDGWEAKFAAATGKAYGWTNERDGRAARELLRSATAVELLQLAEVFISRWRAAAPGSFEKRRLVLSELARTANELRALPVAAASCPCGRFCSPHCGLTKAQLDEEARRFEEENAAAIAEMQRRGTGR